MSMVVVSCGGVEKAQIKVHPRMKKKSSAFMEKGLAFTDCHFNLHQIQITSQRIH